MEQNEQKILKGVKGNPLSLAIPLQKVTFTPNGKVTEDYYPAEGSVVEVMLLGAYQRFTYEPVVEGNMVRITDKGTLPVGEYAVVTTVTEPDGTPRRSKWCNIVRIYDCTDAVLEEYEDFPEYGESEVLDGTVFIFAKGDPFTYDDFTEEQLNDIKRPAEEAAATARLAAGVANQASREARGAAQDATDAASAANGAAADAQQAAAAANTAATNANKAADSAEQAAIIGGHPDYVGEDNYVYKYNMREDRYERTNIYVKGDKGDAGTTDYNLLENKPTRVSQFENDADYATESFVNSSIATATATYRGSYNAVSDLHVSASASRQAIQQALDAAVTNADNNDYCFVQIPTADATPTEIARVERYKHDGSGWLYEYTLNNSGFTAEQWDAINSGITSGDVDKLDALPTNAQLTSLLNGKQDTINDLASIRAGAQAGASAYQKPSSGIPESDLSQGVKDKMNEKEVFWATYGQTTAAEIDAAVAAGKQILCVNGGYVHTYAGASSNYHYFFAIVENIAYRRIQIQRTNSGWTFHNLGVERTSDKVSSWSATPNNTHYPSEKLVKDSLDAKAGIGDVEALQQADTNLQEQIAAEASRASAKENSLDNRLSTVEELAEISVEGGTIGIASSEDFTNRTLAGDAKIPTVGAIMGSVDEEPTPNSDNLVKSGGVKNELALGAVYDVSAKNPTAGPNNDGKFESLSALLSDANLITLIPTAVRKGGMSIKFVQTSDNKYVQYFLKHPLDNASTAAADFANTANWEKLNLEEEVSQLGQEVDGIVPEIAKNLSTVIVPSLTADGTIESNGTFGIERKHFILPVQQGEKYMLSNENATLDNMRYAFATNSESQTSGAIPLVSGTSVITVAHQSTVIITIPEGCNYLLYNTGFSIFKSKLYKYFMLDSVPTEGSDLPVSSDGIYKYLNTLSKRFIDRKVGYTNLDFERGGYYNLSNGEYVPNTNTCSIVISGLQDIGFQEKVLQQWLNIWNYRDASSIEGVVFFDSNDDYIEGFPAKIEPCGFQIKDTYEKVAINAIYNVDKAIFFAFFSSAPLFSVRSIENFLQSDKERILATLGIATEDNIPVGVSQNVFGDILPDAFKNKVYSSDEDILVVVCGDSLVGRAEGCEPVSTPEHTNPFGRYKHFVSMMQFNVGKVKPYYNRLDSTRNNSDFFTKTGTWSQVDVNDFGPDGNPQIPVYYADTSSTALTYRSSAENAAVSFVFDADTYSKCNIFFTKNIEAGNMEIAILEGNGKMLASLDRITWVEANGFIHSQAQTAHSNVVNGNSYCERHRRIWMKKADGVTGTIHITYKRNGTDTSYVYFWGTEMYDGRAFLFDNIGRGGRRLWHLLYNISDIFDRSPDFVLLELPLANDLRQQISLSDLVTQYQRYFLDSSSYGSDFSYKAKSNNFANTPLGIVLPHPRNIAFDENNNVLFETNTPSIKDKPIYNIYKYMWGCLHVQLGQYNNVILMNLLDQFLNEAEYRYGNYRSGLDTGNMTSDGTHLNQEGSDVYAKYLSPLFEI